MKFWLDVRLATEAGETVRRQRVAGEMRAEDFDKLGEKMVECLAGLSETFTCEEDRVKVGDRTLREIFAAAEKEREEAKALITELEWADFHGCFTGDCPHDTMQQCLDDIQKMHTEIHEKIDAAQGRGNTWYVDDGGSGGDGKTWLTAKVTLATAEALCQDGDTILVGEGHSELFTTGGDTIDVANVTVRGMGEGDSRPLYKRL